MKPLNSEHPQVFKNLSVIESCPLLRGNLKKIATFGTNCFVHYLRCPLLRGFTLQKSYLREKGEDLRIKRYQTSKKIKVIERHNITQHLDLDADPNIYASKRKTIFMKEGIDFELDNTCESDFDGESSTDNLTIIS